MGGGKIQGYRGGDRGYRGKGGGYRYEGKIVQGN